MAADSLSLKPCQSPFISIKVSSVVPEPHLPRHKLTEVTDWGIGLPLTWICETYIYFKKCHEKTTV